MSIFEYCVIAQLLVITLLIITIGERICRAIEKPEIQKICKAIKKPKISKKG